MKILLKCKIWQGKFYRFCSELSERLNSKSEKESKILKTTNLNLSFKPFLFLQGTAVFALTLCILFTTAWLILPKPQISQSQIIKTALIKQTSSVVTGQTVKWSVIVKKSDITGNKNLVQLPKSAKNIKVKTITKEAAENILAKNLTQAGSKLTVKERKQLTSPPNPFSSFVAGLLSQFSKFFLANAVESAEQLSETTTPEIITTDDAKFVDLSSHALPEQEIQPENILEPEPEPLPAEPEEIQSEQAEQEEQAEQQEIADIELPEEPVSETVSPSDQPLFVPPADEITEEQTIQLPEEPLIETTSPSNQEIAATSDVAATAEEEEYVEVDYETPAPTITEQETNTGKLVTISSSDLLLGQTSQELTNVLAYTTIPEIYKVGQESKIKIKWKNEGGQEMEFHAFDLNENGKLDYVEWTVPHLSEQIFEIIFISKAFELDQNHEIVADIYDLTVEQDNQWATIPQGHYVRATFEQILDSAKDNTIYAKPTNPDQPATIEVYPVYEDAEGNQTQGQLVATFNSIDHEGMYGVLLTNLSAPTDVFDLKITGGTVDIDWIVDPSATRYWVGGTGNWSDAANHWATSTGGAPGAGNLPDATDNVVFDANSGGGTATVDLSAAVVNFTMDTGNTTAVTLNATFTATGNFTITAGTFNSAGYALEIGSLSMAAGGTFTDGGSTITVTGTGDFVWYSSGAAVTLTGTVIFTGAAPSIYSSSNFYNLTISVGSGNTATMDGDANVTGDLTINSSATLSLSGVTLTLSGTSKYIYGTGGTISGTGSSITISGSRIVNSDASITFSRTVTLATSATLTNNGTVAAAAITLGSSSTLTNNGSITATGTITLSGTAALSSTFDNNGTVTASGALASSGTAGPRYWNQGANSTFNYSSSTTIASGVTLDATTNVNTVNYSRSGVQTVKAANYYNLTLSGSGTKTLAAGSTGIANTFTTGGLTVDATTNSTTVDYNGAAQTIVVIGYHNLTISGSGTKTIAGSITVAGALSITGGTVDFNGQTIATTGNFTIGTLGNVSTTNLGGSTFNIGGNFDVAGSNGDLLTLNAASAWYLNVTGTAAADYVNAAYSNASGGTLISQTNSTDSGNNTNWGFDSTPPVPTVTSVGGDTSPYSISDTSPEILITLDEAGDCYASETDEAYDDMSGDTNCTGDTTTSITCQMGTLAESASKIIYVACQDTAGNKDTIATNEEITMEIDATPPVPSNFSPASTSTITDATPTITFDTDETADCFASIDGDETYDQMSDDTDCTVGTSTSHSCTMADLGADGSKIIYFSCEDDTSVSPNEDTADTNDSITLTLDSTAPVASGFSPAAGAVSSLPSSVSFTLDEVGYCRSSASDLSYSAMASADDCSGGGTTSITCSISGSSALSLSANISCQDILGNENTAGNNTNLSYTLSSGSGGGGGSFSFNPIIETAQEVEEQVKNIPEQILEVPQAMAEQVQNMAEEIEDIINALKPEPQEKQIVFPPIEETVTQETPEALQRKWDLVQQKRFAEISILPLPDEIKQLALNFPKFQTTLEKVGIEKPEDIEKLKVAKLSFPGLAETLGRSSANIKPIDFTVKEKIQIPTDFVFARVTEDKINFNTKVYLAGDEEVIKSITTIQNKPLYLVVKPDKPAKKVTGYIIFKSVTSEKALQEFANTLSPALSASLLDAFTLPPAENQNKSSEQEVEAKKELVLNKFEYQDPDKDGIYTAAIISPAVSGKYEIKTVIDYKDHEQSSKELKMIMVVDPEGYVYEKADDKEARIKGALAAIYWLNPETKQYELWPANDFQQENPQTTDNTGRYSFLVPEGSYYIEVKAEGYIPYKGDVFEVQEGLGVHANIELKIANWWQRTFTIERILLGLITILLLAVLIVLSIIIFKKKTQIV